MWNFVLDRNFVFLMLVSILIFMISISSVPTSSMTPIFSNSQKPTIYLGSQLLRVLISSRASLQTQSLQLSVNMNNALYNSEQVQLTMLLVSDLMERLLKQSRFQSQATSGLMDMTVGLRMFLRVKVGLAQMKPFILYLLLLLQLYMHQLTIKYQQIYSLNNRQSLTIQLIISMQLSSILSCFIIDIHYSIYNLFINNRALMDQQYYYHHQHINNTTNRNIHLITQQSRTLLASTNAHTLTLYQLTLTGLTHYAAHHFHCQIAKIEVLPSKYKEIDDVLLVVDEKGRYGFWQFDGGFQFIQNNRVDDKECLYWNVQEQQQIVIFTGETHHFDVLDTKGTVFFSIKHKIVFIDYTINRLGFKIQKTRHITIPYIQYRYINWIKNAQNMKLLGIIEQKEQRTILNVHNLAHNHKINQQNLVLHYQKLNLMEFASNENELVLISEDQTTAISMEKDNKILYSHSIHNNNGKMIALDEGFCVVADGIVVFGENKYRSYSIFWEGENMLQDKGIAEVNYLMETKEGGKLISIITLNNETYLIELLQSSWKMFYSIKGLNLIYSLHAVSNNSIVMAMNTSMDSYQVVRVDKLNQVSLLKEQSYENVIQGLFCIGRGEYIVICCKQINSIMKYDHQTQAYHIIQCLLPVQKMIAINEHAFVTQNGIYKIDYASQTYSLLIHQEIMLASINKNHVYYSNQMGQVKVINTQSNQGQLVRRDAMDEYIWHGLQSGEMLVGKLSNKNALYVYKLAGDVQLIQLKEDMMISSINHSYSQSHNNTAILIVGLINGNIHTYSSRGEHLKCLSAYGKDPVKFYTINNHFLGVTMGHQQFILKLDSHYELIPVELAQKDNLVQSIIYLSLTNKLMLIQNGPNLMANVIREIDLGKLININMFDLQSYRLEMICGELGQIPTVLVEKGILYVAVEGKLLIYSLQSNVLITTKINYLKDVLGILVLQCGLIVYGIDKISRNLVYVYSLQDYSELTYFNLMLTDSKFIKTIKPIPHSNQFICRGQKYTTIYQINCPVEIVPVYEMKTDYPGYLLQIQDEEKLIVLTDSKRLIIVYSYQEHRILPICRYIAEYQVNDILVMKRCIVYGDKIGNISVLEMNSANVNEPVRMMMNKVLSIKAGSQISTLSKINSQILQYATVTGQIGQLKLIDSRTFAILKEKEEKIFKEIEKSCDFDYGNWRNRDPHLDKLIDGLLIDRYIECYGKRQLAQGEKEGLDEVITLFKQLN